MRATAAAFSVEANIDGLKPSMFADLSPDAVLLRGIDIALSGRLHIEATARAMSATSPSTSPAATAR